MKRRTTLIISLLIVSLLLPGGSVLAQDDDNPLLRLLRLIPAAGTYLEWVQYGDLDAWHTSWEIAPPSDADAIDQMEEEARARWMFIMPGQVAPPDVLGVQYVFAEPMRPYYGFDLFTTQRFISAGQPPDVLTAIEVSTAPDDIAAALTETGYQETALDDGTLFVYSESGEIDLSADLPRVGLLGGLNAIIVWDGQVLIARRPDAVQSVQAAADADLTLADNPPHRAAALALSDPALDQLVGVIMLPGAMPLDPMALFGPGLTAQNRDTRLAELNEMLGEEPLPSYSLSAFATHHTPGATILTVALVLAPGTDAQAAADVLAFRIPRYQSLATGEPLSERWTFEQAIGVEVNELPVALASMRIDDPPTGGETRPAILSWMDLIARRDLGFLLVGGQLE